MRDKQRAKQSVALNEIGETKIMDIKRIAILAAAVLALSPAARAQNWEFGGGAGGSFYPSNTVTNGSASASLGAQTNIAAGLWLANNINDKWGGEVRIDYARGDLKLSNSATQTTFNSEAYALHYDFQYHFSHATARIRPYVAAGGGVKYYRGIGSQVLFQPLSQFVLLTQGTQLEPMISVGGGLKFKITEHLGFRLEVHDYITPVPKDIITPNIGSKISGWMQDITPMAGISYLF
jgi:opacity protein-like surface antigen